MARRGTFLGPATALAIAVTVVPAAAQESEPPRPASGAAWPTIDTVYLRNGGFYRGRVTEIVPGGHVTLVIEGAGPKELPWSEVDRIVAATGPSTPPTVIPANPSSSAAPAGPSAPAPTQPAQPAPTTPRQLDAPPVDAPPRTAWRPNRPLLVTGGIMFGAGYGSNLILAAPSAIGFVGRVFILVFTLALPCLSGDGYLCEGQHGAVQLLVPFAGPFLFASDHPRDTVVNERGTPLSGVAKGLLYTSAGLQMAGVASIITSLVLGRQEPVSGAKRSATSPSFFVLPQAGSSTVGLTVGIHRW